MTDLLRRHDLVHLTARGWQQAIEQHDDGLVRRSLAHWSMHDLPVVVATQGCGGVDSACVAVGIATPPAWGLSRIRLRIARTELRCGVAEFPRWSACADALPLAEPARAALECALGSHCGAVRVYGSFGWQLLTGLRYLRENSDLDLLLEPIDTCDADRMSAALLAANIARPRLDGELCFGDGSAVAWREWGDWRGGRVASIVVKRLDGPSLVSDMAQLGGAPAAGVAALMSSAGARDVPRRPS